MIACADECCGQLTKICGLLINISAMYLDLSKINCYTTLWDMNSLDKKRQSEVG